jgi:hypothetical protein
MLMKKIYTLATIHDIIFNGFNFELPENTHYMISELVQKVGSPDYIKTPTFHKPEKEHQFHKKKKGKTNEMMNDEEWHNLKTIQPDINSVKDDLSVKVDLIRSYLNKLTEKNVLDVFYNISDVIDQMIETNDENILHISSVIFDISSSNRFYSKIYAELYCKLSQKNKHLVEIFKENFKNFPSLFETIEYVDPAINYDKFIKNNEMNEKRKSLASFYFHSMGTDLIIKKDILHFIIYLLTSVHKMIYIENKQKEVEEFTETISILFKKDVFEECLLNEPLSQGKTLIEIIRVIANSKVKECKSLTNKSLFKFMDMIDM